MNPDTALELRSVIDDRKLSAFQILIISLCALVIAVDGFDTQSIGFVGPALIAEFKVSRPALGPVFSAGLVGLMIGSLLIGPIADRIGRKPAILLSVLLFGGFSFMCATSTDLQQLTMWRFLTGIGLGGGIPTALTMVGDYAPESRRGMLVMIVSLANAAGSSIGAFASGEIIPIYGWRSVFIAGGVLPMILAVILLLALSESPRWLALRDGSSAKLRRILKRMAPQHNPPENVRYTVVDDEVKGIPVTKLFTDGRAMSTVLLWIIFFMGFLNLFSLSNWLPTMMASAGASTREAVASTALFQIGGFVGGLLLSGFIQKRGERGLAASYLCMAASIVVTGYFSSEFYVAMIAVFFSGFFLIASVTGVNGYTAAFYPVSIRATGMGWGLGMGRFGSIVGPLAAAYLISLHWSNRDVFMACAIPALIACIGLLCIRRKPVLLPAAARESLAG